MSGGLAFCADFGSFFVLAHVFDVWYVAAAAIGSVVGFFAGFVLHKYVVFRRTEQTASQFLRYCLLQAGNVPPQTALVYLLVERIGVSSDAAKILSIGCSTLWNFVLYKVFVYA